jgi:UDP-glucose:(heptosyl)LPS alpha-1,3-glucosyltransferase
MKLAFCLFRYFPYGGLQRDFLKIARLCRDRGHEVHVYTLAWEGEKEPGIAVNVMPTKGFQNHTQAQAFIRALQPIFESPAYDAVIGFNKMPGLDWYYAGDVCYQDRVLHSRPFWYRWLNRYRVWASLERAVFAPERQTKIMLLSQQAGAVYRQAYQTEGTRFYALPPGIERRDMTLQERVAMREAQLNAYQIPADHLLLLMVGSGFHTKGLDRSLQSLGALPRDLRARTHLMVIGQGDRKAYASTLHRLQIEDHVLFLGGRSDVPHFLAAADLLLHPSRHENTGTVLLEALSLGLPVLTTAACGYAHYIEEARAGVVLPIDFNQLAWNQALCDLAISPEKRAHYSSQGLAFSKISDWYGLHERAVKLIEEAGI